MSKYTEWSAELEASLTEPFPAEAVKQLSKGGTKIDFVSWHEYVGRLNRLVGPGWSMGAPIVQEVGGKLMIGLPVTILGTTRINFGTEDEDKDDYGDAATNAWAQAFKRTCALFGIGLYMYDKGRARSAPARQPDRSAPQKAPPQATDFGAATKQQIEAIDRLVEKKQVESAMYEQIAAEVQAGMSYRRAGELIRELDKLPKATALT